MDLSELKYAVSGPIASIKTPFLESGEIDYEGLGRFIEFTDEEMARFKAFMDEHDML
ncbi:MAG: hypothetical protein GX230_11480 [Lentisphaerae bacterium]|nr:hypothetical protein [Lentisphaerota bacterium]